MKQYYQKEEEFVDEFYECASLASAKIDGEWVPDPHCTEEMRKSRQRFLDSGDLRRLMFTGAAVKHDENGFSSVQIVLETSDRVVNVEVRRVDDKLIATKIIDRSK